MDEIVPADGAKNVMVTMPITVTFSEPVNIASVNEDTFRLIEVASNRTVTAARYTSIEGGRMRAVLVPKNNLMFGTDYQVSRDPGDQGRCEIPMPGDASSLAQRITILDKDYNTRPLPDKRPCRSTTLKASSSPAAGISLSIRTRSGQTYAYVAANEQGWYVVNVTDPTNPYVTHKENWNIGSASSCSSTGVLAWTGERHTRGHRMDPGID